MASTTGLTGRPVSSTVAGAGSGAVLPAVAAGLDAGPELDVCPWPDPAAEQPASVIARAQAASEPTDRYRTAASGKRRIVAKHPTGNHCHAERGHPRQVVPAHPGPRQVVPAH